MKSCLTFPFYHTGGGEAQVRQYAYAKNIWARAEPHPPGIAYAALPVYRQLMEPLTPEILTQARWIWPESHHWDLHNCYAQFRKSFVLAAVPSEAPLFITADQSYHLYVNGRFVCRGPARGYQSHWPYDEADVRPFLREGKNVIAVRAHNPGFSNFQYVSQGYAGLLAGAQWGDVKIVTDASWASRRQAGISKDTVPTSVQLFCQEHVDARIEPDNWAEVDFDEAPWRESQTTPTAESSWNAMPWSSLEPRQIPLLEEREIAPLKLLGSRAGKCAKGYRSTRDVALLRHSEGLRHKPWNPADSGAQPLSLLQVPATGRNRFRSFLIDFGRTVVGNLSLEIGGCAGGEIVDTLHVEYLDPGLTPHLVVPSHCRMAFGSRVICREGRTRHTFFHPFGFRYLVVTVRDSARPLEIGIKLNWIGYPLDRKGSFHSSDTDLNGIWETCAWTQQCCSLDAYVDTPWREQAQWWGDARVQAQNTFFLNGDARLFRRGIGSIASQTAPGGLTYGHAPTMAHGCILPDFTLIWIITAWDYYWQTGSLEPFHAHGEAIAKALDYFAGQTDPATGMAGYDPRYWLFLDWADIFRQGYPTLLNLWRLIALKKTAQMHRISGRPEKAQPLEEWALRLKTALRSLIDKEGLLCDGRTPQGEIVPSTSIHSQTLAIIAGLEPASEKAMVGKILLPFIRGEAKPEVAPSAYWITYVFGVLAGRGYGAEVIAFIKERWTPMVAQGTTWEGYASDVGDGCASRSHAWSAHPLYHLMQTIGGINQTAPGWKEIRFAPVFHGEEGASVVPSPQGAIRSRWQRQGGGIDVELSLPPGVEARVELPGLEITRVTSDRTWRVE